MINTKPRKTEERNNISRLYLMRNYKQFRFFILWLVTLSLFLPACRSEQGHNEISNEKAIDLEEIRQRKKLVAVTNFNSTNYFIYRGQPMGYQYELLKELANYLGIQLELVVNNDLEDIFSLLRNNEVDIIAINLTITKDRKELVSFTKPYAQTRQILVQRKPDDWRRLSKKEIDLGVIRNQLKLAGKTIYVQKNSSHAARLKNLSEEIGDSIKVIEVPEES
ncbi:MAG: transporter substrate-binding domain-containing protein, partial [bacterium]